MTDNNNGVKLKAPDTRPVSALDGDDQTLDEAENHPADGPPANDDSADAAAGQAVETPDRSDGRTRRRVSISVTARGLVVGALIAVLVGALVTFGWLYVDARRGLDAQARKVDNYAHAEKLSLDYAVNAAAMNYQDLGAWRTKLVAGTSPELNDKLTKAADSMQQILVPLQWNSTAQPLVAKVRSSTDGIYTVDTFVSVQTKTVQAPDPLQSTATYSLTIDSNEGWQITDVGGIGAVTGQK